VVLAAFFGFCGAVVGGGWPVRPQRSYGLVIFMRPVNCEQQAAASAVRKVTVLGATGHSDSTMDLLRASATGTGSKALTGNSKWMGLAKRERNLCGALPAIADPIDR